MVTGCSTSQNEAVATLATTCAKDTPNYRLERMMSSSSEQLKCALEACVLEFVAAAVRGDVFTVGDAASAAGMDSAAIVPLGAKRARHQATSCAVSAEKHLVRAAAEWRVLAIGYQHCVEKSTCTLRDLYYCGAKFFRCQNDATKALSSVCNALQVGRSVLGVHATVRPAMRASPQLLARPSLANTLLLCVRSL